MLTIYAANLGTAETNNKLLSFLLISWYLTEQMYLGVLEFSFKFWRPQDPPHGLFWDSAEQQSPLQNIKVSKVSSESKTSTKTSLKRG